MTQTAADKYILTRLNTQVGEYDSLMAAMAAIPDGKHPLMQVFTPETRAEELPRTASAEKNEWRAKFAIPAGALKVGDAVAVCHIACPARDTASGPVRIVERIVMTVVGIADVTVGVGGSGDRDLAVSGRAKRAFLMRER